MEEVIDVGSSLFWLYLKKKVLFRSFFIICYINEQVRKMINGKQ